GERDRALSARAAGRGAGGIARGDLASAGARAVSGVLREARASGRATGARYGGGGTARRTVRRPDTRGDRIGGGGEDVRARDRRAGRAELVGQCDAVRGDLAAAASVGGRRAGEDVVAAVAGGSSWRARRDLAALRGARVVAVQDRVAPDPGGAVHVSVLHRRTGPCCDGAVPGRAR